MAVFFCSFYFLFLYHQGTKNNGVSFYEPEICPHVTLVCTNSSSRIESYWQQNSQSRAFNSIMIRFKFKTKETHYFILTTRHGNVGWVGTDFTFLVPISYFLILTVTLPILNGKNPSKWVWFRRMGIYGFCCHRHLQLGNMLVMCGVIQ